MRVKVVQAFRDKHTGIIHRIGEELEVTKERGGVINAASLFIEEIKETAKKKVR